MTGLLIGIAIGAVLDALLVLILWPADANQFIAMTVALALTAAGIAIGIEINAKRRPGPQPPVKPPAQPPQPPTLMTMDEYLNRPQPYQPPPQPVAQPVMQPLQPPMQPVQPQPQPARQPVTLPLPQANGQHYEPQRPRQAIPWQAAPWDTLADLRGVPTCAPANDMPERDDSEDPPKAEHAEALLPIRPPTAADYDVICQALADCDGSRRRACIAVYGRRDGQTYPWLRKVADYWDISEIDRPGILVWELLGTREIPGNLANRLGLEMTADQVSEAIDYAGLTRCQECEQWCILDELDDNDACTSCTA